MLTIEGDYKDDSAMDEDKNGYSTTDQSNVTPIPSNLEDLLSVSHFFDIKI